MKMLGCWQILSEWRPRQKIRTAGNPQFSLFITKVLSKVLWLYLFLKFYDFTFTLLCLSGFFLHCLLEKVHVIRWFGRWHHELEGSGTVWHCGRGRAGWSVSFPCLFSVIQLMGFVRNKLWIRRLIAFWCLLGRIRWGRGQGEKLIGPQAGKWWALLSQIGSGLWAAFPWKCSWEIKHIATALSRIAVGERVWRFEPATWQKG